MMGKLANDLSEKSKFDDSLIVGSEIRAALQELSTECSNLKYALKLVTGFVPVDEVKFIAMLEAYEIEVESV